MKILLTNLFFDKFGGSQLVTLELGEELQARGHEVLIYSPNIEDPMKSECTVPLVDQKPDMRSFDIIWSHHGLAEDYIPRTSQRIVFNHMSSYVALEFPRDAARESQVAWKIFANSPETAERIQMLGVKREIELFQNPAPKSFRLSTTGEYILLVSNHRPEMLADMARETGIALRIIGEREEFTRVTPSLMQGARFVICNGKTVQYALRAGVPVFLYDQFGGPGWLTGDNFHKAEWFNFSGRCTPSGAVNLDMAKCIPIHECPDRFKLEVKLEEMGL